VNAAAPDERSVTQLFDLAGRVALVTGGCGHLGSAMCRALAESRASVIVTSRSADKALEFAATLTAVDGQQHQGIALDHLDPDSIASGFATAAGLTGQVDILINNAHEPLGLDWNTVTPEAFTRQLANATGYFQLAKLVRDLAVARQRAASIVLLGSMYGLVGSYPDAYADVCAASPVAYHALKGGIVQMTRHLAVYWAKDRVRVNCLCPGPFPSPSASSELVDRLKTRSPMARMGMPKELKGAVVFLASDASSYMTGQNLVIDGGWTSW
jgi:NAD(P)-dependent dehydrogenase (short-subunit alcohol dehydrogenase family)